MSSSENTYQHSTENENNNSAQASNKKLAFFLPNFFTALNMACGFAGVQYALHENFFMASSAVTLGAIFDSVDGRIARMTGTQSSFGEQFDSMSDLISFGLAPSLIFHMNFLSDAGRLGYIVSFMFLSTLSDIVELRWE